MRIFDSHAHLSSSQYDPDRDSFIEGLIRDGVEGVIECAAGIDDIERVRKLSS